MNKNFNKGIEELKNIRMTDVEKARMLENIFATPIPSPYMRRIPVFAYAFSLLLIISLTGTTYVSGSSLPGDLLYPVKTRVVEQVLDVVNSSPENKIVWEEAKVERRIVEAEQLLDRDELDDEKLRELEQSVKKSSTAFAKAVNIAASSTATSSVSAKEKAKDRKQAFRKRLNERKETVATSTSATPGIQSDSEKESSIKKQSDRKEQIKQLKDAATRTVDDYKDEGDEDKDED